MMFFEKNGDFVVQPIDIYFLYIVNMILLVSAAIEEIR